MIEEVHPMHWWRVDLLKKDLSPIGFTYLVIMAILIGLALFRALSRTGDPADLGVPLGPPGYVQDGKSSE